MTAGTLTDTAPHDEPQSEAVSPFRQLLGNRNFRWLWLGEGISLLGDQFYMIALPWLVLQLTGDPLAMGTVLAIEGIPRALFMLVGGAFTDRFSPRNVMLASNLVRMGLVALLSVLVLSGLTNLWILYVFALIFGLADAFFFPAQSSIVPQMVNKSRLQIANALIHGTMQISLFAGPVLAGTLIAMFSTEQLINGELVPDTRGIGLAFAFDAVTFLASALTLWVLRLNKPSSSENDAVSMFESMRQGLAYVWNDGLVRAYFIMIAIAQIFIIGPVMVGIPVLADTRFPEGAAAFGIIMSAFGGGSLLGTGLAAGLPKPPNYRLGSILLVVWSSMGLGIVMLGLIYWTVAAVLVGFLMGIANGYVVILFVTWLQERTPEHMLGRVMSLLMFATSGIIPVSTALIGAAIQIDLTVTMVGAGSLMTVIVMLNMLKRELRMMGEQPSILGKVTSEAG